MHTKFFSELETYKERTSSSCLVAHTSDFLCQTRPMKIIRVDVFFKVQDKDNSRNRNEAQRGCHTRFAANLHNFPNYFKTDHHLTQLIPSQPKLSTEWPSASMVPRGGAGRIHSRAC